MTRSSTAQTQLFLMMLHEPPPKNYESCTTCVKRVSEKKKKKSTKFSSVHANGEKRANCSETALEANSFVRFELHRAPSRACFWVRQHSPTAAQLQLFFWFYHFLCCVCVCDLTVLCVSVYGRKAYMYIHSFQCLCIVHVNCTSSFASVTHCFFRE